jgi:hypothetical protein
MQIFFYHAPFKDRDALPLKHHISGRAVHAKKAPKGSTLQKFRSFSLFQVLEL